MSTCEEPQLKEQLYRFVRRELEDAEEQRRIAEHLESCAECRAVFQELQWMMGSMRPSTSEEHQELMSELRRVADIEPAAGKSPSEESGANGFFGRLKRWLSSGGAGTSDTD